MFVPFSREHPTVHIVSTSVSTGRWRFPSRGFELLESFLRPLFAPRSPLNPGPDSVGVSVAGAASPGATHFPVSWVTPVRKADRPRPSGCEHMQRTCEGSCEYSSGGQNPFWLDVASLDSACFPLCSCLVDLSEFKERPSLPSAENKDISWFDRV